MQQQFSGLGIQFQYPEGWELTEDLGEDEASITVSSPESAFWSVTVLRHRPDPEQVLQAALDVFHEEYDEVDVAMGVATLAQRQVASAEVDFVCLELTNSAFLRAFRTGRFTLLVLYQATDQDLDEQEPLLKSISDSLVAHPN